EGIEKAEFSADVSPLAGLEASEFTGGDVAPMDGLDPIEFRPPDRPSVAVEGLEPAEFEPMGLEAIPDMGLEVTHDDPFGPPPADMPADLPADTSTELELTSSAEEAVVAEAAPEPAWPAGLEDIDASPAEPAEAIEEAPPARSDARADARASVAGLPLLEPFGTPTPLATPTVSDLPLLPSLEEAETVPIDLEAVRRSMETPATFVTETMAQVYVQQGHTEKAIEVYRQLVAQTPGDAELAARLRALEAPPAEPVAAELPAVEAPSAPRPARQTLGFDTPLSTEPIEEPAPANSMLKATSFDGISLSTPDTPSRGSAPVLPVRDSVATGPSAREFFARFAHRSLTPIATPVVTAAPPAEPTSAPSAAGRMLSPLDELFGTGVLPEDEAAAHRLAGVGATSGPSGGSALDSLFGEGPSAPMPAETPRSSSATTPSRGTVPRASEKLRFDQFFASSTPVEGSAATPAPAPAPDAAPELGADDASLEDGEPGEDDDLDQFQGWLRGLTS
ncbi:MAG: tetratricopeptide repeat protein, partial [Gemmatimonadaceae bacterium]|nr:tetratricopeptide repeat protein [Gemmatimonadaceae bacterium]